MIFISIICIELMLGAFHTLRQEISQGLLGLEKD